ncbi:MAG: hypothetical protein ACC634_01480 [Hyphomicrobiales bacterium]
MTKIGQMPKLTEEELRRQRGGSLAIAGILVALVVVFFVMTVVRMGNSVGG